MNSTYGDMAYVLYLTAQEPAQELSDLSKEQKSLMEDRAALRELKKKSQDFLNSNESGGQGKELTKTELNALKEKCQELGIDTTELDQLIAIADSNGTGHVMSNGDRHIYLNTDTDWGKERTDLFAKFEAKWNEGIKDKIQDKSDQDDQIAFQMQVLFNKYSTRMGMATSTVQNDKQNSQQILQKL